MDGKKVAVIGATRHGKTEVSRQLAMYRAGAADEALRAYAEGDAKLVEYIQSATVCPSVDDELPKCLSIDRASPHYSPCGAYIGVRVDGEDMTGRVVEYNVVMGWARIADAPAGTKLTYYQVQTAPKVYGVIEVFWAREPNRQVRRQLARLR